MPASSVVWCCAKFIGVGYLSHFELKSNLVREIGLSRGEIGRWLRSTVSRAPGGNGAGSTMARRIKRWWPSCGRKILLIPVFKIPPPFFRAATTDFRTSNDISSIAPQNSFFLKMERRQPGKSVKHDVFLVGIGQNDCLWWSRCFHEIASHDQVPASRCLVVAADNGRKKHKPDGCGAVVHFLTGNRSFPNGADGYVFWLLREPWS